MITMTYFAQQSNSNIKNIRLFSNTIIGFLVFLLCVASTPLVNANETISGYYEIGLRSIDLDGSEAKYKQHLNLDSGLWLSGFGLTIEPNENNPLTPDKIEISASNLGSEPYQNLSIGIRKYGSYRFSYKRQKSEYFYQDILIDLADEDPEMSNGGDFHSFNFDRVRDHLSLDVNLTKSAKLLLDLNQYTKKGDSTTVLDVEREEFELEQPIDQKLKNYKLGFEYRWDKAAVTLSQRNRDFYNDVEFFLHGLSEGSRPVDPTRLDSFLLEQPYGYDSNETQVNLNFRSTDNLVVQADVLYANLDMDVHSLEMATGIDFLGNLLQTNISGDGRSDRTIRQLYIGGDYAITDHLRLTASLRDQELEQKSDLDLAGVINAGNWLIDNTSVALSLEAIINKYWTISGGVTIEDRQTSYDQVSSNVDQEINEESQYEGYFLTVAYRSNKGLTLNLSAEESIIDDPFTLSSPKNSRNYRLRVGYKWDTGLKFSSSYIRRNRENELSGWEANSKQTNLRLSYNKDPVSLSLGTALVDIDRSIDQLVTAGNLQVLFPIDYQADSDFWDGIIRWKISNKVNLISSYRHYDNNGSFVVKRNDSRLAVHIDLPRNYSMNVSYRNIDYREDFESFDVGIWELKFGQSW
jgi:hypothetical protein